MVGNELRAVSLFFNGFDIREGIEYTVIDLSAQLISS